LRIGLGYVENRTEVQAQVSHVLFGPGMMYRTFGSHAACWQILTSLPLRVEVAPCQDDHLDQVVQPIAQEDGDGNEDLQSTGKSATATKVPSSKRTFISPSTGRGRLRQLQGWMVQMTGKLRKVNCKTARKL